MQVEAVVELEHYLLLLALVELVVEETVLNQEAVQLALSILAVEVAERRTLALAVMVVLAS
jgi:uncharacterized membrane protein